jgi:hypothetical protein
MQHLLGVLKMASRQEARSRVEALLRGSKLFYQVRFEGDLDIEGATLTVEYQKAPGADQGRFDRVRRVIGERLQRMLDADFYYGIEMTCKPEPEQPYSVTFTRIPTEAMPDDPAKELYEKAAGVLSDKFIFK